jgi:hypothetical protein
MLSERNETYQLFVCTVVNILGENINTIKENTEAQLQASRASWEVDLEKKLGI